MLIEHKQTHLLKISNINSPAYSQVSIAPQKDIFYHKNYQEDNIVTYLSNWENFYNLYSIKKAKTRQETEIIKKLQNPIIAQKLFANPKVIKASTIALIEIINENLKEEKNNKKIEQQLLLKGILQTGLSVIQNNNNNKALLKQCAFGNIFEYGIFYDPETNREKAEVIINRWSASAAVTAATLANTGIGDKIALTYITKEMTKRIFKTYDMKGAFLGTIIAIAVGSNVGALAASTALTICPGVGNFANATITYTLHQITGRAIANFCEENQDKCEHLSKADAVSKFTYRLKLGLDVIKNDKLRNIISKAIDKVVDTIL